MIIHYPMQAAVDQPYVNPTESQVILSLIFWIFNSIHNYIGYLEGFSITRWFPLEVSVTTKFLL